MNIYWPIFKNLELEFSKLMYAIHVDDDQLSVYSSKISDLILRAAIEIESITKELYYTNGGEKTGHIKYDDDALDFLIKKWSLDKKVVIISSVNCFQTDKTLFPFVKNEIKTGKANKTFSWNNSYQNIKHDRAKSLKFGSIKYLFDILSALYVLNLYFSNKVIPTEKDALGVTISPNVGSDIFAIMIAPCHGHDGDGAYMKRDDFEKSVYYIDFTEPTSKVFYESMANFNKKVRDLAFNNPKVSAYLSKADISTLKPNWLWDALGKDDYLNVMGKAQSLSPIAGEQIRYEAKLNKNEI